MSHILHPKRGLVLLLAVVMILSCFTGCYGSRTTLPESETENLSPNLVLDPVEETTEPETQPVTEATEAPTEAPTSEPTKETKPYGYTGTVVGNYLNIRNGPGTEYGSSKSLSEGTPVLILEVDLDGALPWGRIDEGWICLNYVRLDSPDDLLAYAATAVGITINSNVFIYTGPGDFYTRAGTLSKNVRLNIFGIFGNWARIAEGWILLDHVYVDGTEGPDPAVMGTVTGNGVYIRSGPGTEYGNITSVSTGARVKIFYQVTLQNRTWGCTENGWICMEYVRLDNDPSSAILGHWYGHNAQSADDPKSHILVEWNFKSDGTYTYTEWVYDESMSSAADITTKYATGSGKYTFDGTTLTMNGTECAFKLTDGKLYLDAGYGTKAHVNTSMDDAIKAFLNEKYPSTTPDQPDNPSGGGSTTPTIDPAIVGSWAGASASTDANGVHYFTMGNCWTFSSDGTFALTETESIWIYNDDGTLGEIMGAGALSSKGTFTFDGSTLTVTCTHQEFSSGGGYTALATPTVKTGTVSISNGVMTINWGGSTQSYYSGTQEAIALKLFPG